MEIIHRCLFYGKSQNMLTCAFLQNTLGDENVKKYTNKQTYVLECITNCSFTLPWSHKYGTDVRHGWLITVGATFAVAMNFWHENKYQTWIEIVQCRLCSTCIYYIHVKLVVRMMWSFFKGGGMKNWQNIYDIHNPWLI